MPGYWITPEGTLIDVSDDTCHEKVVKERGFELLEALEAGWIRIRGDAQPQYHRPGGWECEVWDIRDERILGFVGQFLVSYPLETRRIATITTHVSAQTPLSIPIMRRDLEDRDFTDAVFAGIRRERARLESHKRRPQKKR